MRHWRQIRDRLMDADRWKSTGNTLKGLIRLSESPKAYGLLASAGLAIVILLNLGGGDRQAGTDTLYTGDEVVADADDGDTVSDTATSTEPDMEAQAPETAPAVPGVETLKLKRGETLSGLLTRARIDSQNGYAAIAELRKVTNLRQLKVGQTIRLVRTAEAPDRIQSLTLRDAFDGEATVEAVAGATAAPAPNGFASRRLTIPTLALTQFVEGEISDNLYMSGKRAGLPDKVIVELIRLMSYDVDFERDIREGDRFQVYFERTYAPGLGETDEGRILQLKLDLKRGAYEATYFKDEAGDEDYYDAEGKSARRALMKTPLDVAVITSSYGSRKHPVLGYTRMHKGVDFRAPTGTPIMAAGDGTVERASRYGSYGNYIRIRHNGTYSTAYAHLSKYGKGIKAGVRVKQGQIIGYAGATGRVSAAHLHYEVMIDGKQANPMTLKLPSGKNLKGKTLTAFLASRDSTVSDIARIQYSQQILLAASQGEEASLMPPAPVLSADVDAGLDGGRAGANVAVEP